MRRTICGDENDVDLECNEWVIQISFFVKKSTDFIYAELVGECEDENPKSRIPCVISEVQSSEMTHVMTSVLGSVTRCYLLIKITYLALDRWCLTVAMSLQKLV